MMREEAATLVVHVTVACVEVVATEIAEMTGAVKLQPLPIVATN